MMRNHLLIISLLLSPLFAIAQERVQLKIDSSEAEAILSILEKRAASNPVTESDWQRLFSTVPYQRLKQREASMHRDFTDEDFRKFVLSPELAKRATALQQTLTAWDKTDFRATAGRILPYLPPTAVIRASVYPVIKPRENSFVWETDTNPAIFMYLDPDKSQAEFESTVAHESHHIGYSDVGRAYEQKIKTLPPNAQQAAQWMGAFGEGLAMLAAAGTPDAHPLKDYSADQRMRWDQDTKYWDQQLIELNQFFKDVIDGGFAKPEVANHVGFTFFGYRGPWYTVGYKMAQIVEKQFGRAVLVECTADPRFLLAKYNEAAEKQNASGGPKLPLWSPEVLTAVGVASK